MIRPISAYVLCCNNAATVRLAVESLMQQTWAPTEILVIDDGSTDESVQTLQDLPVKIVSHAECRGRGAGRSTALQAVQNPWMLSCDATAALPRNFTETAARWLEQDRCAGVFGRWIQPPPQSPVERWRGRHLFKTDTPMDIRHGASLSTYGTLLNASIVRSVGGFNPALRAGEDADLGQRLLTAGYDVVFDPQLTVLATQANTLLQVLERYARWNTLQRMSPRDYARQIWYAWRVMVAADLRAGDPAAALISLLAPHFQFWRT